MKRSLAIAPSNPFGRFTQVIAKASD